MEIQVLLPVGVLLPLRGHLVFIAGQDYSVSEEFFNLWKCSPGDSFFTAGPKRLQRIDQSECAYCCGGAPSQRGGISGHHNPGPMGGSRHQLWAQAALLPTPVIGKGQPLKVGGASRSPEGAFQQTAGARVGQSTGLKVEPGQAWVIRVTPAAPQHPAEFGCFRLVEEGMACRLSGPPQERHGGAW